MTQVEVHLVRAFSLSESGGNLAGVVMDAEALTNEQRQAIAKQVGLSETVFVSKSEQANVSMAFFTPTQEVDFCGHATIAAFWLLHHLGRIAVGCFQQETKAGIFAVEVSCSGEVMMEQKLPTWLGELCPQNIAPFLGIEAQLIEQTRLPVQIISTGLADAIIPVPYGVLDLLETDNEAIAHFCRQQQLMGFHVFELNPPKDGYIASCRNFAPVVGVPEESATGTASGALACYLNKYFGYTESVFEQGRAMQMPSHIITKLMQQDGQITRVQVAGQGALDKSLWINVED